MLPTSTPRVLVVLDFLACCLRSDLWMKKGMLLVSMNIHECCTRSPWSDVSKSLRRVWNLKVVSLVKAFRLPMWTRFRKEFCGFFVGNCRRTVIEPNPSSKSLGSVAMFSQLCGCGFSSQWFAWLLVSSWLSVAGGRTVKQPWMMRMLRKWMKTAVQWRVLQQIGAFHWLSCRNAYFRCWTMARIQKELCVNGWECGAVDDKQLQIQMIKNCQGISWDADDTAATRRNLLTCDDATRRATYGHLRYFARMSPRGDSPTERLDASEIDAAISEAGRLAMQSIGNLQPQVEPMDQDSSEISGSLLEEQRRFRYRSIALAEASDPELWMDVRHGGPGSSSDSSMNTGESNNEPAAEPLTGNEQFQQNLDEMVAARHSVVATVDDRLASAEANGLSQEEILPLENQLNYFRTLWWCYSYLHRYRCIVSSRLTEPIPGRLNLDELFFLFWFWDGWLSFTS